MAVSEDLSFKSDELPDDRSLILVDDDRAFVLRLAKAMEGRGFEVRTAHSVEEGLGLIHAKAPAFAVACSGRLGLLKTRTRRS
jgi:two-component system response regulator RegA